jgi:CRP-like cAMP-binding protein
MNPVDLFSHETNPVHLAAGETLFRQGDAPESMFVVLEGSLDVLVQDKVVENAKVGSIIGEMALIDQSPRGATVVAHEPSKLARLDAMRFHRVIQQNPFFATHVMKVLVGRIRQMDKLYSSGVEM